MDAICEFIIAFEEGVGFVCWENLACMWKET